MQSFRASFWFFLVSISFLHAEREVQSLSKDWRFIRQDVDLYADTKTWETVTIPHTRNALDGQAGSAEISSKQETFSDAVEGGDITGPDVDWFQPLDFCVLSVVFVHEDMDITEPRSLGSNFWEEARYGLYLQAIDGNTFKVY